MRSFQHLLSSTISNQIISNIRTLVEITLRNHTSEINRWLLQLVLFEVFFSFFTLLWSVSYKCMCAHNGSIQQVHIIVVELMQLWSERYYVQVFWMLPHPSSYTRTVWCVCDHYHSLCHHQQFEPVLVCEFLRSLKLTFSVLNCCVHLSVI
jgi:hypothetical protein